LSAPVSPQRGCPKTVVCGWVCGCYRAPVFQCRAVWKEFMLKFWVRKTALSPLSHLARFGLLQCFFVPTPWGLPGKCSSLPGFYAKLLGFPHIVIFPLSVFCPPTPPGFLCIPFHRASCWPTFFFVPAGFRWTHVGGPANQF